MGKRFRRLKRHWLRSGSALTNCTWITSLASPSWKIAHPFVCWRKWECSLVEMVRLFDLEMARVPLIQRPDYGTAEWDLWEHIPITPIPLHLFARRSCSVTATICVNTPGGGDFSAGARNRLPPADSFDNAANKLPPGLRCRATCPWVSLRHGLDPNPDRSFADLGHVTQNLFLLSRGSDPFAKRLI